jgi:hypothetical protein
VRRCRPVDQFGSATAPGEELTGEATPPSVPPAPAAVPTEARDDPLCRIGMPSALDGVLLAFVAERLRSARERMVRATEPVTYAAEPKISRSSTPVRPADHATGARTTRRNRRYKRQRRRANVSGRPQFRVRDRAIEPNGGPTAVEGRRQSTALDHSRTAVTPAAWAAETSMRGSDGVAAAASQAFRRTLGVAWGPASQPSAPIDRSDRPRPVCDAWVDPAVRQTAHGLPRTIDPRRRTLRASQRPTSPIYKLQLGENCQ